MKHYAGKNTIPVFIIIAMSMYHDTLPPFRLDEQHEIRGFDAFMIAKLPLRKMGLTNTVRAEKAIK